MAVEAGRTVKDVCRKHGGMEAKLAQLKRMYADLALENLALKDVIEKSSDAGRETGDGRPAGVREHGLSERRSCAAVRLSPRYTTTSRIPPGMLLSSKYCCRW